MVRLFSAEDLSHLFSDFAEKYPDRKVVCKTKDGSYYPVVKAFDDDGVGYVIVEKSDKAISASEFKEALDHFYWSEGGVVVSFSPTKSYAAIFAKHDPVFFEDKVDGEDVIAFRLGETLCDTRIEDPYDDDGDFFSDDDTVVTVDDLCDEEEAAQKEELKPDVTAKEEAEPAPEPKPEPVPAPETKAEVVAKADDNDKGDIILRLVSYSGSVIKMMTTLSGIDGIDEEKAFNILQKLPSVVREGISAKAAMKIGAILEDAGATVELAKSSAKASDPVVKTKSPKPKPEKHKSSPKPKSAPKPKPAKPKLSPEEYVDLGLSVKWARCNLGASAPEETGDYFAWGEVAPKSCYDWATYGLCKEEKYNKLIKYCTKSSYGKADNLKKLESEDDAATASLGKLRTPTIEEWQELRRECTWKWTDVNGRKGYLVTGSTGNSIFLPAAGWKESDKSECMDAVSRYWSSSLDTDSPWNAKALFESNNPLLKLGCGDDRCWGFSIRPVTK